LRDPFLEVFFEKVKKRASVKLNDVLINSTGDGTIGRVAIYDRLHPAIVDGHITIVRFNDPDLAWYAATYLLSTQGQNQLYRYINGSSGQVEIYPQDIARVWIPPKSESAMKGIANSLRSAVKKHEEFYSEMRSTLNAI
jgi:restriction endonuclease S subunit